MSTEPSTDRRLKFYGLNDYGTYFQVEQAVAILEAYNPLSDQYSISDVIELDNARLFVEKSLIPTSYSDDQRAAFQELVPKILATVGKFFNSLSSANIATIVVDVNHEHLAALLQLFSRYKLYDRCPAAIVLPTLDSCHIRLGQMLACQRLVRSYDEDVRTRLLANVANAEHVLRKYIEKSDGREIYLPQSFTDGDAYKLINDYLDSNDPNPNFVQLVALARLDSRCGIDAKTKLKAQRKHDQWSQEFFEQNSGVKTGCEVAVAEGQAELVKVSMDSLVAKISYSRDWLEGDLDYPTILNNFIYVLEFVDSHMLLTMPSYQAQLGVFERIVGVTGREDYVVGAAFRLDEWRTFLSLVAYDQVLKAKEVDLESVIAWFFSDYLKSEFGAANFKFVPSSKASTYLEKCRHLFAEMESVVRQFSLYVENGELDTGLLGIASEQVRYKDVPSLLDGKYAYPDDNQDIRTILHLLFSDQSGLRYISEDLKADDAAELLASSEISYENFADHQRPQIDYLIQQGVLEDVGGRVQFVNVTQFRVLRSLFRHEAVSYYHYGTSGRAIIDQMVAQGWLVRQATLLSVAEASYFNYCLNSLEFSNGPDLRNKYLHGSHMNVADENEHFQTYITALKLLIALVIKMNDDFWLHDGETSRRQPEHEFARPEL